MFPFVFAESEVSRKWADNGAWSVKGNTNDYFNFSFEKFLYNFSWKWEKIYKIFIIWSKILN